MSFFRKILPSVESLAAQCQEMGAQAFAKQYLKYDALQGSSESIEYVRKVIEENQTTACTTCQK
jgi:hypothetical protein